jgi:hypothetical protein
MNNIETLKIALEALVDVVHWYQVRDKNDEPLPTHNQNPEIKQAIEAITAIRQAVEQAQQAEPVAFASHGVVNWIADKQFQHEADLYTSPQRQWVGLTDEEIDTVWDSGVRAFHLLARELEAKLRSKND